MPIGREGFGHRAKFVDVKTGRTVSMEDVVARLNGLEIDLAELERDRERLDWIEEHATSHGGGKGFTYFVPVDHELGMLRAAIDAAMGKARAVTQRRSSEDMVE